MDGAITIILLSLAMFGGCLLLGFIPLVIRLSEEKLKFVTVLGAGLLCGTALAIIIPEGMELLLGDLTADYQRNISQSQVLTEPEVSDGKQAGTKQLAPPHFIIGVSLVMGFLLMFVVDQVGNCIAWQGAGFVGRSLRSGTCWVYSVLFVLGCYFGEWSGDLCRGVADKPFAGEQRLLCPVSGHRSGEPRDPGPHSPDGQQSNPSQHPASSTPPVASTSTEPRTGSGSSLTATLGLVIHAAADGVALGTAAGSSQISLQVIVFFAVILHKAPASFGLVSYLMHAGLEKRQIQKHLLVFSLAAPLLAIITYFIVSKSNIGSLHQTKATGIGLLFSAGTFLYVASVHVLPEVSGRGHHRVTNNNGKKGLGILESLTLIVGCTIPVLLSLGLHDA